MIPAALKKLIADHHAEVARHSRLHMAARDTYRGTLEASFKLYALLAEAGKTEAIADLLDELADSYADERVMIIRHYCPSYLREFGEAGIDTPKGTR